MAAPWIADASALTAFRENPERFRLRYRKHLVPAGPTLGDEALEFGRIFHALLEKWFANVPAVEIRDIIALYDSLMVRVEEPMVASLRDAFDTYAVLWPRPGDPFTVVHNETYLEEDLGTFRYCGLVDRLVEFPDGSRYVMDTKTTRLWLGQDFFLQYHLSQAQIGYVALERARGQRCDGFFLDVVQLPRANARIAHVKCERYGPIPVAEWQLNRWKADTEHTLRLIEQLEQERGIEQPWPVWENFKYGKLGLYQDFYLGPPETHKLLAMKFEVDPWEPKTLRAPKSDESAS